MKEPESWKRLPAQFGDRVRIRPAPETEAAEIAGCIGVVNGITTVSVTGVEVVGSPAEDVALNIAIDESEKTFWLAPALVEFIDHNPGVAINLVGVPRQWIRDASGKWVESARRVRRKEWFHRVKRRFWKSPPS